MGRLSSSSNMKLKILLIAFTLQLASAAFREGDFIPTARKIQVAQLRTNWEDLLGQHCSRFGQDSLVMMDLLKPKRYDGAVDEYKLQFSFNGEQHITPWVLMLGKHAPKVPMLVFNIVRSGDEIRRVRVEVQQLPKAYQHTHGYIFDMFSNASHWPKEVVVNYKYEVENDEDISRGLYLLYALGLFITAIIGFNSLRSYYTKLRQFLEETALDDFAIAGRSSWHAPGKGE